jgi:hypothetical protein
LKCCFKKIPAQRIWINLTFHDFSFKDVEKPKKDKPYKTMWKSLIPGIHVDSDLESDDDEKAEKAVEDGPTDGTQYFDIQT